MEAIPARWDYWVYKLVQCMTFDMAKFEKGGRWSVDSLVQVHNWIKFNTQFLQQVEQIWKAI